MSNEIKNEKHQIKNKLPALTAYFPFIEMANPKFMMVDYQITIRVQNIFPPRFEIFSLNKYPGRKSAKTEGV